MPDKKNNILKDLPIVILGFIIAAVAIYFIIINLNKEGKQPLAINNILKTEDNKPAVKDGNDNAAEEILNDNKDAIDSAQKDLAANNGEYNIAINQKGHIWGNAEAPVKLIVYSDFACPFCADFADTVKKVKEEFGEKVAVEYRHFPLRSDAQAIPAAIASECADAQGKFWEMHDKLFADNKEGLMNTEVYQKDAKELSLNASKFNKCLESEKYKDKVEAQAAEGEKAGVAGAPASFVNGEKVDGAVPFEDFKHSDGQEGEGMKNIILRHLNDK